MNIPYSLTACSNQYLMRLAVNSESPDGAIFGVDILASPGFSFTVRLSAHVEALNPFFRLKLNGMFFVGASQLARTAFSLMVRVLAVASKVAIAPIGNTAFSRTCPNIRLCSVGFFNGSKRSRSTFSKLMVCGNEA